MDLSSLGTTSAVIFFLLSLVTAALAAVGAARRSPRLVEASVQALYATTGVACFSSALIIYAFLADDFSLQYVQHTSDSGMPLFYKITAFWGGLDGSLLFWALTPAWSWRAMRLHESQWRWFRKLHVLLSRYSYVNELQPFAPT